MPRSPRTLAVIAGPNGAGKSTIAPALLRDVFGIREFVNADTIAQGMSGFDPEAVAVAAGRVMLRRLRELAASGADFAFETTLASRSFAPWIAGLRENGYEFRLAFIWIPTPDLAVVRVRGRVAAGGHHVPEDVVRRRYERGVDNFFKLYRPLADRWLVLDNTERAAPRLIAQGRGDDEIEVLDERTWNTMKLPDVIRERAPAREPFEDTEAILRAAARGVREALRRHKLLGQSVYVWRDGRVVEIAAEDIVVPPEIPPEPR
jgi:predicted ABC-type ATPase